jgi:hypothetical protein
MGRVRRANGWTRSRAGVVAVIAALGVLLCLVPAASAAGPATAIAVQATHSRAVYGSDRREHIDYDLVITNAFTAPVTLTSLRVRGDGETLLTLKGNALAAKTFQNLGSTPMAVIPNGSTVVSFIDVALPRSAGRTPPKRLTNRLRYSLPSTAPLGAVIGSKLVRLPLRTDPIRPLLIRSPLRGSGWFAVNGCCADPTSPHRSVFLPAKGHAYATPEIFAIDWIHEVNGFYFKGDGSRVTDWLDYGATVHAVRGGTVVTAVNDRPEVPPFIENNPTVQNPADFAGNNVVERIAPHRYAIYAHMQPGSVRVARGQHLKTGQRIGRLGNSGNTTAPHLHFGIYDGRSPVTSNSVPFAIKRYTFQGNAGGNTPGQITLTGKPRRERRSEPLINAVTKFSR